MSAAGLSDAQIEEFREAFHLFDRNQDGTITSSNLANVLKVGVEHIVTFNLDSIYSGAQKRIKMTRSMK